VTILRIAGASFVRAGVELVAPFDFALRSGERAAIFSSNERAAGLIARIAAAVVKPTTGAAYIGDFDARLQPAQAKRSVAFVPAARRAPDGFARALGFYAAAFGVAPDEAAERAREVIDALGDGTYARNAALALSHDAALIVLDRPPPSLSDILGDLRPHAAVLSSQVAPDGVAPSSELREEALR